MSIELAPSSGFCFGVDNAVKTAYELVDSPGNYKNVYMFGKIIHNNEVINDLKKSGMQIAFTPDDVEIGSVVLIRAHGISPSVQKQLEDRNAEIIDCTCPFVIKIHKIVASAYLQNKKIIITGAPEHPEVIGINGCCNDTATIISDEYDAENYSESNENTILVSQTTFSFKKFKFVSEILNKKIANLEIFDTICNTTEKRQFDAEEISKRSDIMIVIGDHESSNTRKLFDICSLFCRQTYMVENASQIDPKVINGILPETRIGIVAGASTPQKNIGEVISKMSEKVTQLNQNEQEDLIFQQYVDEISQLHRGSTVKGNLIRIDNDFAFVDVKDKSEGRIPVQDLLADPDFDLEKAIANHEEITVYVRSIKNTDQGKEIILSRAKADNTKGKAIVEAAFNEKTPLTVKITGVVKDGVIGSVEGVDVYIHRTQLEAGTVSDLEPYKGKSIEILITQFDAEKRRLKVNGSRRVILTNEKKEKVSSVWSNLEIGKIYTGIVRSLTDFGAFVDLGGVDGLVHVSELSWNRIKHPSEVVNVGDSIEVFIKDFDPEKKRISLGYKRMEDDPYRNLEERFPVGNVVSGKVVRMFPFGAFIEIAEGVDALCHVSQISSVRLVKPSDVLTEGMIVEAKVIEANSEARRVSVSIKEVNPIDPEKTEPEVVESPESDQE